MTKKGIGSCAYCGCYGRLTKDHVIAKSKGGKEKSNLLLVCYHCNQRKGIKSLRTWLRSLKKKDSHCAQSVYVPRFFAMTSHQLELFYQMQRKSLGYSIRDVECHCTFNFRNPTTGSKIVVPW
jgi:hypothetical protein